MRVTIEKCAHRLDMSLARRMMKRSKSALRRNGRVDFFGIEVRIATTATFGVGIRIRRRKFAGKQQFPRSLE